MAVVKTTQPVKKIKNTARKVVRAESASPPKRRYRAILFQIILLIVAAAFGVLTFLVKTRPAFAIDLQITKAIQMINFQPFAWFMSAISWPGFGPQSMIITGVIVLLIYFLGLHWESAMALIAAIFCTAVNVLVKDLVQRPRPTPILVNVIATLKSYSFPSGHVMYYLGFFGFIVFLVFSLLKPSVKRTLLLVFFGGLIVLIGVSRIYVGQHWASDVLGAYLLGSLTLIAIILFYRWGKTRFFVNQPVAVAEPKPVKKGTVPSHVKKRSEKNVKKK